MHNLHGTSPTRRPVPSLGRLPARLPLTATTATPDGPGPTAARYLARRLTDVLDRLGLLEVVRPGWTTVDGATVRFGDLDVPTAHHLLVHLEGLAACVDEAETGAGASVRARRQVRLSEAGA